MNENHFYNQSNSSPFGPGAKSPGDHARHCMEYRASTRCAVPVWLPRDIKWSNQDAEIRSGVVGTIPLLAQRAASEGWGRSGQVPSLLAERAR